MRYIIPVLFMLTCCLYVANAQQKDPEKANRKNDQKPPYDIRKYFFVMLTAGANRTQDSVTRAKLQEGHLNNITRLYNEGIIKVAGPFGDNGNWKGIFIFDCASREDVEKYLQTDPAISSGSLAYEVHPWYTSPIRSFVPGKPK